MAQLINSYHIIQDLNSVPSTHMEKPDMVVHTSNLSAKETSR